MTNNSQDLALAFAKEVMGYEEGQLYAVSQIEIAEVLKAVREWCNKHNFRFELQCVGHTIGDESFGGWDIHMWPTFPSDGKNHVILMNVKDISSAAMEACLEAERKRRGE